MIQLPRIFVFSSFVALAGCGDKAHEPASIPSDSTGPNPQTISLDGRFRLNDMSCDQGNLSVQGLRSLSDIKDGRAIVHLDFLKENIFQFLYQNAECKISEERKIKNHSADRLTYQTVKIEYSSGCRLRQSPPVSDALVNVQYELNDSTLILIYSPKSGENMCQKEKSNRIYTYQKTESRN